jgi:hypothetical protein
MIEVRFNSWFLFGISILFLLGTPINNIPKVQKYDLDLHRLFKVVRMLGGYNKVRNASAR